MTTTTFVGLAAAVCTTFAFLPQLIKTWNSRSTKDISLGMFVVFTTGILLWLTYGLLQRDVPLIAGNCITLVFAVIILFFKLRYG